MMLKRGVLCLSESSSSAHRASARRAGRPLRLSTLGTLAEPTAHRRNPSHSASLAPSQLARSTALQTTNPLSDTTSDVQSSLPNLSAHPPAPISAFATSIACQVCRERWAAVREQ